MIRARSTLCLPDLLLSLRLALLALATAALTAAAPLLDGGRGAAPQLERRVDLALVAPAASVAAAERLAAKADRPAGPGLPPALLPATASLSPRPGPAAARVLPGPTPVAQRGLAGGHGVPRAPPALL